MMATQKSVGVTIGEESSQSSSQSASQSSSGSASHESSQQPGNQPATQPSQASSHRASHPSTPARPTQIPNQALLVSGTKLPRRPLFNSVSTGSPVSDQRATIVRPRPIPAKRTQSTLAVAWGRLPQTGEVAVGSSVLLGIILLMALSWRAYRVWRRARKNQ